MGEKAMYISNNRIDAINLKNDIDQVLQNGKRLVWNIILRMYI